MYRIKKRCFPNASFSAFVPFKLARNFFTRQLSSGKVNVLGHQMVLDSADSLSLSLYGVYEPFETEMLCRLVRKGSVVLDIGANIGYYSLLFARNAGPEGRVYAFEPDPVNKELLSRNIRLNKYDNVVITQKAVSNVTGPARLFLSEENAGDHRIFDSNDGRRYIEVDSVRLDDHFADFKDPIDLVKMDIQGAEYSALQGMQELIGRNRDLVLCCEYSPHVLERAGASPLKYLRFLLDLGFLLFEINEERKSIDPAPIDRLLKEYRLDNERFTNLLCLKNGDRVRDLVH